jgi:hypothetical protein
LVTERRGFQVVNDGGSTAMIRSIQIQGDPALSLDQVPGLPASLGPGESLVGYVVLTPPAVRTYSATISIASTVGSIQLPVLAGFSDRKCVLRATPTRVDFGLNPSMTPVTIPVTITNLGIAACGLVAGTFAAPADPAFTAQGLSFPTSLAAGTSTTINLTYEAQSSATSTGFYDLSTDDPVQPRLRVGLSGSGAPHCDGVTEPCSCYSNETPVLQGFRNGGSGVFAPSDDPPFTMACAPAGMCSSGQVVAQPDPSTSVCADPPPTCDAGQGLTFSGGRFSCTACDIVVQFGGIYKGLRVCATNPSLTCPAGEVPTFTVEAHQWSCEPICNGGQYDRIDLGSGTLCVPC